MQSYIFTNTTHGFALVIYLSAVERWHNSEIQGYEIWRLVPMLDSASCTETSRTGIPVSTRNRPFLQFC